MARNSKVGKSQHKVHPFFPSYFWKYWSTLDKKLKETSPSIVFALLFFIIACLALRAENLKTNRRVLGLQAEIQTQRQEIANWEKIVAEKPDFRDGWLKLAAAYAEAGNREKAQEALNHAKNLDPNNQKISLLEELLRK
ncbi:MAG TPA: tetratricopeptide repeat protein [Patescibacteria group bacterium]|nr:tetratricopeptide repeat protein [Patescibacteria group bacterium]